MTYNEIRAEVLALGFETEIENEERLKLATRRALNLIFTERPLYKTLELYKSPNVPILKLQDFSHKGGVVDTIEFSAKSFSFTPHGKGSYRITDENGVTTEDFVGEDVVRGFLHGSGKIEFLGDYFYTVSGLAFYDELYGESVADIPTASDFKEYDIKRHAPDFLCSVSSPEDRDGNLIKNSEITGGILKIPSEYSGVIRLTYKASAPLLSNDGEQEITLPEGCSHLVPLLTAAYFWLDDDAEKAEYYMSLYREAMIAVKLYTRAELNNTYTVPDNWA